MREAGMSRSTTARSVTYPFLRARRPFARNVGIWRTSTPVGEILRDTTCQYLLARTPDPWLLGY